MTYASVLSEKNLPLEKTLLINSYNLRLEASKGNFLAALADFFLSTSLPTATALLMWILPISKLWVRNKLSQKRLT